MLLFYKQKFNVHKPKQLKLYSHIVCPVHCNSEIVLSAGVSALTYHHFITYTSHLSSLFRNELMANHFRRNISNLLRSFVQKKHKTNWLQIQEISRTFLYLHIQTFLLIYFKTYIPSRHVEITNLLHEKCLWNETTKCLD